jgi:sugar lactone lactonase YvrE
VHTRARAAGAALTLLASLAVLLAPGAATGAAKARGGRLLTGTVPMRGMNVSLMAATPGQARPVRLGAARSRRGGAFSIAYRRARRGAVKYLVATRPCCAAEAGFPVPANSYRLAAALGAGRVPRRAAVNERTTVATGYAMAQFIAGGRVAGKNPGLRNAAAMTRDLVSRRNGGVSPVLGRFPNGGATSTLRRFDSLANLLALCRRRDRRCAQLLRLTGEPGGGAAPDTLQATVQLARNPWHNMRRLFAVSRTTRRLYRPALGRGESPAGWTLALRFEGSPRAMNGPGNLAIDAQGNAWVGTNYEYSRRVHQPVCASQVLLRFTPTGRYYPGSPYTGGGLSGVGFGITIDPHEHVWVGNFGFAGRGCTKVPPHNSVSELTMAGEPLSPDLEEIVTPGGIRYRGGWEQGSISWPQGTVSDREGNIWIANCGNNSVTQYPLGNPNLAFNRGQALTGLARPFDIAVNDEGDAFVTGNESRSVAMLGPNGVPLRPPIVGGGLHRPMGIASDSRGYIWVANSTWVVSPCPGEIHPQGGPKEGGTVTLITPNGERAIGPIQGAGLHTPWGVAVDGADNVWVANFGGKRLSELCGTRPRNCPPGRQRTGGPISPEVTGYGFDGLTRDTGLAIDPSGNVWLANNWRTVPIQTNPGGYQVVAYLGLAAPIHTPLIGPPEQP